jgi:hypothetical protein
MSPNRALARPLAVGAGFQTIFATASFAALPLWALPA